MPHVLTAVLDDLDAEGPSFGGATGLDVFDQLDVSASRAGRSASWMRAVLPVTPRRASAAGGGGRRASAAGRG